MACNTVMAATPIDPGVVTILRRHSTEDSVCENVNCAQDDPTKLTVIGSRDEFGFARKVECTVCGERMTTECYNSKQHKSRIFSTDEVRRGDQLAWHTTRGTAY
jgi:hypothetical protein